MISHTSDIVSIARLRRDRGEQFCVTAHIRPGEYTGAYAPDAQAAERVKDRFINRGCYQIKVTPPIEGDTP